MLLNKGAEVNVHENQWGLTPLHVAAKNGHLDVVELLISHGADMNAEYFVGETALQIAKGKGYDEIVSLLRKHGAKE